MTTARRVMVDARRALLVGALGAGFVLPGCATKKDMRALQTTIAMMQVHQDSAIRELQRQQGINQRILMDTVRSAMAITLDARGQTSSRLAESSGLLESIRSMTGQLLESTQRLNARMDAVEQKIGSMQSTPVPQPTTTAPSNSNASTAQQLYDTGVRSMADGNTGAARLSFKSVVSRYHGDPLAPDAQFQVAETFVAEQSYADAYDAFSQIAQEWPSSSRAAEGLYRAGVVAQGQKDYTNARKYYNMVVRLYDRSDSAKLARTALNKLPK